jgi:hypothetical protein
MGRSCNFTLFVKLIPRRMRFLAANFIFESEKNKCVLSKIIKNVKSMVKYRKPSNGLHIFTKLVSVRSYKYERELHSID